MPGLHSGPGILTDQVGKYLESLLKPRDPVLTFLEKDAAKNGVPIVGPLVGNLLSILAMSCAAKNILEIGTATGYSGIWLGRVAKKNGGKLWTIEADPDRRKIAAKSFSDAGISDAVEIVAGDAKKEAPQITKKMSGRLDLIFIDVGEKSIYVDLYDHCKNALRSGGFLVADNTLWGGFVAEPKSRDIESKTMREFNSKVYSDSSFHTVIIPLDRKSVV